MFYLYDLTVVSVSIQRALESMGDVEWCPRCNAAVIRESESSLHLAQCTNCYFTFCTDCRESWHQVHTLLAVLNLSPVIVGE